MSSPERNDPCPCGSGKKFKHCHLGVQDAATTEFEKARAIHDRDGEVVLELLAWGRRTFPSADLFEIWGKEVAEDDAPFALPLIGYHGEIGGRRLVDRYFEAVGHRLDAVTRAHLDAERAAWLSVWEVVDVDPGKTISLRDLLSGETRQIIERGASQVVQKGDGLLARLVDHGGIHVAGGIHPAPMASEHTEFIVKGFKRMMKIRRKLVPLEVLRTLDAAQTLVLGWTELERFLRNGPPPTLQNSAGDALLLTTDHFTIDAGKQSALERAILKLGDVEENDPGVFVFLSHEARAGALGGQTVLGTAVVNDHKLRLETNSVARADDLRRRIAVVGHGLITFRLREHTDPMAHAMVARASGEPPPRPEHAPAMQEALRAVKAQHYATWPDEALPAFGGKTARQMVATKAGRGKVEALLQTMEQGERRLPVGERYDFAILRRALGLDG